MAERTLSESVVHTTGLVSSLSWKKGVPMGSYPSLNVYTHIGLVTGGEGEVPILPQMKIEGRLVGKNWKGVREGAGM